MPKLVRYCLLWVLFWALYLMFATSFEPAELLVGAVLAALALAAVSRLGLQRIRALHSGNVGDYVIWLMAGAALVLLAAWYNSAL